MPIIEVVIEVRAPIDRVFDLSRSIDLHTVTTAQTKEKAIAGVTTGLIGDQQEVTWRARHFGVQQELTSSIIVYQRPSHFRDSMVRGTFKRFDHDHFFETRGELTVIRDRFDFESPWGFLGRIADRLILSRYLRAFLMERNERIKTVAESNQWRRFLP
jgi:ligand-binding SRPBCC domain-containing protein